MRVWPSLYHLTLALWVGGMALFTFVVTPIIFRSYDRDMAGQIVGKMFPAYFGYNLALSILAVILFFLVPQGRTAPPNRLSLVLLIAALVVNLFITFSLYPQILQVKQEISSFERESLDSASRTSFRKLHALSAVLNLFLLADGVTLPCR